MKIYIAGPFFNDQERESLKEMIALVRKHYSLSELYIPMEHVIPNAWDLPNHVWAREVYKMDVKALEESDMVIAMYSGHYSDTGTAWELGYATAKGKTILGYIPDWAIDSDMSLMVLNCLSGILEADDVIGIKDYIERFNQK